MSGASPRGPGVVVGTYPGCLDTVAGGGSDGNVSYHIPPTGTDGNNCPTGGSYLTVDEINGIEQSLNCILTRNGLDNIPNQQLCEDPCMVFDAIDAHIDYKISLQPSTITDLETYCDTVTPFDPSNGYKFIGFDATCNAVMLNYVEPNTLFDISQFCTNNPAFNITTGYKLIGLDSGCNPVMLNYVEPSQPTPTPYSMPSTGTTDENSKTHSVTVPATGGPWEIWWMRIQGGISSAPTSPIANGATHTVSDSSINSSGIFPVMLVPSTFGWTGN